MRNVSPLKKAWASNVFGAKNPKTNVESWCIHFHIRWTQLMEFCISNSVTTVLFGCATTVRHLPFAFSPTIAVCDCVCKYCTSDSKSLPRPISELVFYNFFAPREARESSTGTYRYWIPVLSVELGFWIPWAVFQIPQPTILDSTNNIFWGSRFRIQKFPGFQSLDAITWDKLLIKTGTHPAAGLLSYLHVTACLLINLYLATFIWLNATAFIKVLVSPKWHLYKSSIYSRVVFNTNHLS